MAIYPRKTTALYRILVNAITEGILGIGLVVLSGLESSPTHPAYVCPRASRMISSKESGTFIHPANPEGRPSRIRSHHEGDSPPTCS